MTESATEYGFSKVSSSMIKSRFNLQVPCNKLAEQGYAASFMQPKQASPAQEPNNQPIN